MHRPGALKFGSGLGAMLIALVFAGCTGQPATSPPGSPTPKSSSGTAPSSAATDLQNAFVAVVERVRPSIVQIQTNLGLGSGVVVNDNGDVVTNNHVISGASTIAVTTAEGKTQSASLVGTFAAGDLAVIHVAGHLDPVEFADSATLKVGMIVLAIGNPLGLQSSVTEGIVSAVDRTVSEPGGITLQPRGAGRRHPNAHCERPDPGRCGKRHRLRHSGQHGQRHHEPDHHQWPCRELASRGSRTPCEHGRR